MLGVLLRGAGGSWWRCIATTGCVCREVMYVTSEVCCRVKRCAVVKCRSMLGRCCCSRQKRNKRDSVCCQSLQGELCFEKIVVANNLNTVVVELVQRFCPWLWRKRVVVWRDTLCQPRSALGVVHILVYRIPFTRMWTNWTTGLCASQQSLSNQ
jgi:hypothetical protein